MISYRNTQHWTERRLVNNFDCQKLRLNLFLNQTKIDTRRSITSNIKIGHLPSPQISIKFPSLLFGRWHLCKCYFLLLWVLWIDWNVIVTLPPPLLCTVSKFPLFHFLTLYTLFDLFVEENRQHTSICPRAVFGRRKQNTNCHIKKQKYGVHSCYRRFGNSLCMTLLQKLIYQKKTSSILV